MNRKTPSALLLFVLLVSVFSAVSLKSAQFTKAQEQTGGQSDLQAEDTLVHSSVALFISMVAYVNSPINCTAAVYGANPTGNVTWSSSSSTGTFSPVQTTITRERSTVIYTDSSSGTVTLNASYSGDSNNQPSYGDEIITLYPHNLTLSINPSNTTVQAGTNVQYKAILTSSNHVNWDVTWAANWTMDLPYTNLGDVCVVQTPYGGSYKVTASFLDLTSSASLTVIGPLKTHGDPTSLVITPSLSTTSAGSNKAFTAIANDSSGNLWDVSLEVNWSINNSAGGSWSGYVYTSENAGNWTVTAALLGLQATAQLQVLESISAAAKVSIVQSGHQNSHLTVANDTQFSVDVRIENSSLVWGYSMDVVWNPSVLKLQNIVEGSFLDQQGPTFFLASPNWQVSGRVLQGINDVLLTSDTVNGSGVLVTLTFEAIGTGNSSLLICDDSSIVSCPNQIGEGPQIPFTTAGFTVSVELPGQLIDFMHNGNVSFDDLVYFADAYINFYQNGVLDPACDLNHDGIINFDDVVLFCTYWAEYFAT